MPGCTLFGSNGEDLVHALEPSTGDLRDKAQKTLAASAVPLTDSSESPDRS